MNWEFSDAICSDRLKYLQASISYDNIVKAMKDEVCRVIAYPEPGNATGHSPCLENCFRPSFQFKITSKTGDLFFNSPNGYRAAYCRNIVSGSNANRLAIDALTPRLLEAWRDKDLKCYNEQWADKALRHYSAKIWIYEGFIYTHTWTNLNIEIKNPVWIAAAKRSNPEDSPLPYLGVRAPICHHFEVKGAWIDPKGGCRIGKSPNKRAHDIRCRGWS